MSEHEIDPLVRLRAVDPVAGASYEHADVTAMLARVTARPQIERVSFVRGFRLRVASAVAVAALLSAGAIVALETAAPSLSVLALGAAPSTLHSEYSSQVPTDLRGMGAPSESGGTSYEPVEPANVTFVAGPDLSAQTESAPSYSLTPAGDFGALSQKVESAFSVSGTPSATPEANSSWTAGDTSGRFLSFWTDNAELNWEYTNSSEAGNAVPVGSPPSSATTVPTTQASTLATDDADLSAAEGLVVSTGVTGPFGTPSFSHSDAGVGISWTTVTIPWIVGSSGTGFQFDVTFDPTGTVISADGVNVSVVTDQNYPLISQVAGVAALSAQQASDSGQGHSGSAGTVSPGTDVNPGGPIQPVSTTTTTGPGDASGSSGSSTGSSTTTTATAPTIITLTSAFLQYAEYTLADGGEVLLPQWIYRDDDGSQWSVLAVDPAYVTFPASSGGGVGTP